MKTENEEQWGKRNQHIGWQAFMETYRIVYATMGNGEWYTMCR